MVTLTVTKPRKNANRSVLLQLVLVSIPNSCFSSVLQTEPQNNLIIMFLEICNLPKVSGPCEGYYPQWYYDKEQTQCLQFIYGGCLGNNNRFETREECMGLCVKDNSLGKDKNNIDIFLQ